MVSFIYAPGVKKKDPTFKPSKVIVKAPRVRQGPGNLVLAWNKVPKTSPVLQGEVVSGK